VCAGYSITSPGAGEQLRRDFDPKCFAVFTSVRGSFRGRVRVIADDTGLLSLVFEEVCDPAGQFLSGVFRYVDGIATSARTILTFWRNHRDLKPSDNCAGAGLNGVGVNF
jgi:hypothetical protein